MKKIISRALPASVLTVALLVAGCGGSDDATTTAITKTQLIKQGDAICAKADRRQVIGFKALNAKGGYAGGLKGQEKMLVAIGFPSIDTEIEELGKLGAPSGDEKKVTVILLGMEKALKELEKNPAAAITGSSYPFAKVSQLAGEYGFKACADPL